MSGFFSKQHSVAQPGYSRWLVPPAALSVHLCIGQAYAFSVFNDPLTRVIGVASSAPDDWKLTTLGWIFSLAIVFLGLSAAFGGKWLEKVGPRLTMFVAACCFGGGFLISALGVHLHEIWLIYLGYGVIGGIGLGLGYVSPVSTLIKWFPDRRGMATGMCVPANSLGSRRCGCALVRSRGDCKDRSKPKRFVHPANLPVVHGGGIRAAAENTRRILRKYPEPAAFVRGFALDTVRL